MSSIGGRRKAFGVNTVLLGISALCLSAVAAPPARAQSPATGLAAGYSANANKPIDIEADSLEVNDKTKIAVFKGNVSATQGDFNLRASEIEVTYTDSKGAGADKTQQANKAANSQLPGNGSIKQINAKGKVLVTGKDNQTATGDWAVFEVEKQLVTLGGDVVVSQGTNTIKGARLVMDIKAGTSRFDQDKERIKVLLTPKAREKEKDKDKEKAN
jgi:lipopolysaccharide export system protein LptA